jgi:hypothetical protein
MKTIRGLIVLAAVAITCLLASPAAAQVACNRTAIYDASTNGATRLVVGNSANRIFICGYVLMAGGTANVSLTTGTGTNCGTNTVAITPAFPLVAQARVPDNSSVWRGLAVQPSLDLCINSSAGVAVQAIVYFSQQ